MANRKRNPMSFDGIIEHAELMPVSVCNPDTPEGAEDAERQLRAKHGKRFAGMDVVDNDIRIGSDPTRYAMYVPRLRAANRNRPEEGQSQWKRMST